MVVMAWTFDHGSQEPPPLSQGRARWIDDEFITRRSPMAGGYCFDTLEAHETVEGSMQMPRAPACLQASGLNSSTNATTFSEDISQGFRSARSDAVR